MPITRGLGGSPITRGLGDPAGLAAADGVEARRDWDALHDAAGRLLATGAFTRVIEAGPDEAGIGSAAEPEESLAYVEPFSWSEEAESYGAEAGSEALRTVAWRLTLEVADEDPARRCRRLDRLAAVASGALSGQSLGGFTLPDLTRLPRGQYTPAAGANRKRLRIAGEFAYYIGDAGSEAPDGSDAISYLA